MRIRVSGEIGGMIIVAMVGLLVTAMIAGILNFFRDNIFQRKEKCRKIFSTLSIIVWILGIIIILLDLTNILPLIRNILFIVFDQL